MNTAEYFDEIGIWPAGAPSPLRGYILGFVFSLGLTLGAYFLATYHALPPFQVALALALLALLQFGVQCVYFLHIGRRRAMRERLIILGFTAVIVLILVAGSIWIMFTLNQRMMPDTAQMEQYMTAQQGI